MLKDYFQKLFMKEMNNFVNIVIESKFPFLSSEHNVNLTSKLTIMEDKKAFFLGGTKVIGKDDFHPFFIKKN